MTSDFDAGNEDGRLTPAEASAVVRLWIRRQWERQDWPTVTDIAEALEISAMEATVLLAEVRATETAFKGTSFGGQARHGLLPKCTVRPRAISRLAIATFGLTSFFSLVLEHLLA